MNNNRVKQVKDAEQTDHTYIFLLIIKLREECPNTEFILVRIFLYSDQKKVRIWTFFTQCQM